MIQTFSVAHTIPQLEGRYHYDLLLLLDVSLNEAYFAHGHGFAYETRFDFSPRPAVVNITGQFNGADRPPYLLWVTSEAIGIALEGLLAALCGTPW